MDWCNNLSSLFSPPEEVSTNTVVVYMSFDGQIIIVIVR